ncbi:unnamed protein product [Cuscuta campestris]|uniref:RING-type domain-containing protein n=1 Tax=Cuscuta campestris TaxID=132261 RepID=A0A484L8L0_9ASTE|nr:unnamed protein product [Cuscuta campestris]
MTSASELFYSRRTRLGRISSEFDSDSDRISIHNHVTVHRHHRHRRSSSGTRRVGRFDSIYSEPLPRSRIPIRCSSVQELEPVGIDAFTSPSGNYNSSKNEITIHDNFRTTGNGGLPGPVLLARERLLQRLRGFSLSENRCNRRASTSSLMRNVTTENDSMLVGARDSVARSGIATDFIQIDMTKRPPGLTQESLNSLRVEVFSNLGGNAPQECSICLEAFSDGDALFHLPCGHRFHNGCLIPWVRTCGDCPYCRASVLKHTK